MSTLFPTASGRVRLQRMSLRKIEEIVRDRQRRFSGVGRLVAQIGARQSLTEQFRALLPDEEAGHFTVANRKGPLLVVHARSAAWATRLRFRVPDLLPSLRRLEDFAGVEEVRVRPRATGRTGARDRSGR